MVDIATIIEFVMLIIFLTFNVYKIKELGYQQKNLEKEFAVEKEENIESFDNTISKKEIVRSQKLFEQIETYFIENKPYTNPDFSISDLAAALDTNVKYISLSINQQALQSFNNYVNSFRINMVKEMIGNKMADQYTLQHIYLSAGFNNQSTFNRIFKNMLEVTPTEYIKNQQNR
ncbi:hypothetical protein FACS1894180_6510 [Bacteroidia bacterium]|nr:hypothetical protein FACS1894180_6510 [Bacteroidia bacterium]